MGHSNGLSALLPAPTEIRDEWARRAAADPCVWAEAHATLVHPIRGRISFRAYPYQRAILRDRSPRRLIVKARQIGVSQVLALEVIHHAITEPDATILLVSRNQELAANLLSYCRTAILGVPGVPASVKDNESEMAFGNGSRIKSLPANRATGRGFAAARLYLDEYAFLEYAAEIYRSVSPAVGHGGRITVCSTPDGRGNHFYQLWSGIEGGDWSRHILPWRECPEYDDGWYERERPKYTTAQWASEYDCEFAASGQAVFRAEDVEGCADGWHGLQPPRPGRQYVTAWDIGRRQDATVGITLDVTGDDLQIVAFDRFLGLPYPAIQQRIEQRAAEYRGQTWVESNGVGDPVIENLACQVQPWVTTAKTKVQAITALALAHEQHRLKHAVPQLRLECQLYQWQDDKLVQDCVMAAAIAVVNAMARGADAPHADPRRSRWAGEPTDIDETGWSGRWR